MKAQIFISLHAGIHDPEAVTTLKALHQLGFASVSGLSKGRYLEIELTATTPEAAQREARDMCDKLLANPVMEQAKIVILP